MTQAAHIDLKDGRRFDFAIRTSRKSRSVRLKLDAREGLSVTAPIGVPSHALSSWSPADPTGSQSASGGSTKWVAS